jgi:hypothetical protein
MIAQLCNSHGFSHGWAATKYHHIVFREIVKQVEELYGGDCIVVDGTWLGNIASDEQLGMMYPNITRENIEHIFYVDLVDPPEEAWGGNSKRTVTQLTTARNQHSIPVKSNFQFWAYFAANEYSRYKNLNMPWIGNRLFLSYNRKPYNHREQLIRTLTEAGLLCEGIVTMGNEDPENAITVDENINIKNANILGDVGVPNDIASLGDHDVWQQAFINIVTETVTSTRFLSEKIWKPIIGKRPFLLVGPPDSLSHLHELGFRTFDQYWDEAYQECHDEIQIEGIHDILTDLSMTRPELLKEMYADMQDILEHNHRHFFGEFARSNEALISTIVKDEM